MTLSTSTVKMSKQLKRLKIKHCMDWKERDKHKIESSWLYKLISSLAPASVGWIIFISAIFILAWGVNP